MGFIDGLIKGVTSGAVEGLGNTASKIIGNFKADPTEIANAQHELKMATKEYAMKDKERKLKDKMSAREMYKNDSSLQKIFAMVFLVAYVGLVFFILYSIFFSKSFGSMENWTVALITTLITTMSNKLNTITDFLFAGNSKNENNIDLVALKKEEEKEKIRKLRKKCKALSIPFDEDDTIEELEDLLESKKKQ